MKSSNERKIKEGRRGNHEHGCKDSPGTTHRRSTTRPGRQAADLHGQPRHHPDGSAGAGRDAALLHGEVRQRRQPQSLFRMGRRRRRGNSARAHRQAGRRDHKRDHLHLRRHRERQPRHQGRGRDVPREGQPHHHCGDRAQGRARHLQAPGKVWLPRHLSAGAERRPDRSRRPEARHGRQDDPGHDHVRQQRNRRAAAGRAKSASSVTSVA